MGLLYESCICLWAFLISPVSRAYIASPSYGMLARRAPLVCRRSASTLQTSQRKYAHLETTECIITGKGTTLGSELEALVQLRPGLKRLEVEDYNGPSNTFLWTAHRGEIQLDSATFEDYYLSGKVKLTDEETSMKWNDFMTYRLQYIGATKAMEDPSAGREEQLPLQVDNMAMELNAAVGAVQLASSMSRSLQKVLLQSMSASSKSDRSPVTVADFAVQALILDALHEKFPGDRFIAEEDSDILRNDEMVRTKVIEALISATGQDWSAERLFNAVDIGKYDGFGERVWVLDPVDGTKGFLRGEHYCIALGLMINMKPEVSVLGCPNLQLDKVLSSSDPKAVGAILGSREYALEPGSDASVEVYPPTAGSVYYAVSDLGAFARHLGMPLGAGYEVCTSMDGVQNPSSIVLCESTEASHGDRRVSTKVKDTLGSKKEYLRLDGQCKYCVVGSGTAHGNLRLPPAGYQEKIWDHVAGSHFVREAGGKVTDLEGNELSFHLGRLMSPGVTGIVAANGVLHTRLLETVQNASADVREQEKLENAPKRVFGQES